MRLPSYSLDNEEEEEDSMVELRIKMSRALNDFSSYSPREDSCMSIEKKYSNQEEENSLKMNRVR
jgi:hypothetical protein